MTSAALDNVAKLRDVVSVKIFGAVGDGVADDTAAVQAALNTGKAVYFPDGTYAASGLTTGALNQKLFGSGRIVKNGNGPLLSSTHSGLSINDLYFSGTGYTGDNLSFTGTSPTLINVTSENAAGRAFKSTKSSTVIIGGHYRTSDNTASGYDIEFGDGVNSSLYNFIDSMSTNQSFGGVLCQTADLYANNCQIGKLDTTGSNAAKVFASRIIGNISLSGSGSVLSGCGIAANVTFNAGTSKCALVNNDYASGSVIVNNGNGNNFIETNVSAGSRPIMQYGPSSSDSKIAYDTAYTGFAKDIYIATGIRAYSANTFESATVWGLLTVGSSGQVTLGTNQSFVSYLASSTHQFIVSSVATAAIDSTSVRPETDDAISSGTAAKRWSVVYSASPTINTSDEREKQQIRELSNAEKAVAIRCKALVRAFKFNDAVAKKGASARWHFGVIAQDIIAAFEAEGLDAFAYGVVCFDEWAATSATPAEHDDSGNELCSAMPASPAGDRYGVRYEELLAFVIAALLE